MATLLENIKARGGGSAFGDDAIQSLIDANTAEVVRRFGGDGEITIFIGDTDDAESRSRASLRLIRPADVEHPIAIVEIDPGDSADPSDRVTLADDDYRVIDSGRTLVRLFNGTNARRSWAPMTQIDYTPAFDAAARNEAVTKLTLLDLSYRGGLKSERAGDYSFSLTGNIALDREQIFSSLNIARGFILS